MGCGREDEQFAIGAPHTGWVSPAQLVPVMPEQVRVVAAYRPKPRTDDPDAE